MNWLAVSLEMDHQCVVMNHLRIKSGYNNVIVKR